MGLSEGDCVNLELNAGAEFRIRESGIECATAGDCKSRAQDPPSRCYTFQLINKPSFEGASIQALPANVFVDTLAAVKDSKAAGRPWVVANDEQGNARTGVMPDSDDPDHDNIRQQALWGNIMVSPVAAPQNSGPHMMDLMGCTRALIFASNTAGRRCRWRQRL